MSTGSKLTNACRECGDCYSPVVGPDTDGDPCPWCRVCGCADTQHTRMDRVDALRIEGAGDE